MPGSYVTTGIVAPQNTDPESSEVWFTAAVAVLNHDRRCYEA